MADSTAKPVAPMRAYQGLALAGLVTLCAMALRQALPPLYDEQPYLELARRLSERSSWMDWLVGNDQGAAGPLHACLHFWVSGGTGFLPAPWFRSVNLVLFAAVLGLLAWTLRAMGQPTWKTWACLGVPMVWPLSGMALTEIPAMVGITAAVGAALRLGRNPEDAGRPWMLVLLALGAGVGLLGRQPYLFVLPGLWWLASSRRNWLAPGLALAIASLPLAGLFMIWGGTVPPLVSYVSLSGWSLAPRHGVAAAGYLGVLGLVLAPAFLRDHRRWCVPLGLAGGFGNVVFDWFRFTTLTSVLQWLPADIGVIVRLAANFVFAALGAAFLGAMVAEMWRGRDRVFIGLALGVFGLVAVCVAVTHLFSSRYVAMALPLLIPMVAPWIRPGWWAVARLFAGMAIGAAALASYYQNYHPLVP